MYRHLFNTAMAIFLAMTLALGLTACGENSDSPTPLEGIPGTGSGGDESGTEGSETSTEGNESANEGSENTGEEGESGEESGDESGTTSADATEGGEAGDDAETETDIQLVEIGCPNGQKSCEDENGLNDPSLCVDQPDTICTEGCCVPTFKCAEDLDCAQFAGSTDMGCPDDRFDCACNEDTGACFLFVCNTTADCAKDRVCLSGICSPELPLQKIRARVSSTGAIVTAGTTAKLLAAAYTSDNNSQSITGFEFEWQTDNSQAVEVAEDGTVTGGLITGSASISVRVKGGETTWSEGVTVYNVGARTDGSALRVIAANDRTSAPLNGHVVVQSAGVLKEGTLVDGVAEFFDLELPADVHVFGENHHATSIYSVTKDEIVIHCAAPFLAELAIEKNETLPESNQTFVGEGDLVKGSLDYQNYKKQGEIELGITGMGVDQGLFAFNFGLLVGPDVSRYFDQDLPAGMFDPNEEQQLPGGVTFSLGYPVLSSYWLAGGPGAQTVWSLGGRVGLTDSGVGQKVSSIIASVDGGGSLEIGEIVATLLPLFESFYSGVSEPVLASEPNFDEPIEQNNLLSVPLSNGIEVVTPDLLSLGDGIWADTLLLLGGAMTDDRRFVPLGVTAGTDIDENSPTPDGKVDGDPVTPAPDNFTLYMAPTHHHIQTDTSVLTVVTIAAVLEESEDSPEAGSGIMTKIDAIAAGPRPNATLNVAENTDFLPVIQGATWNENGSRLLALPEGSEENEGHFRRVMFENSDGTQWHVFVPQDVPSIVIPDPALFEITQADPAGTASHFVVNAFDPEGDVVLEALYTPGGNNLGDLLQVVERASYIREKVNND